MVGKEMGVCPYYATRKAVKQAQVSFSSAPADESARQLAIQSPTAEERSRDVGHQSQRSSSGH